jgi:hypothetical protein
MAERPAVPSTLEEALSPEWLTAALGLKFPGIEVVKSELGPIVSRVSTNARFSIETAGELPDGLSPNLCVKGYFDFFEARSAGTSEAGFYRELRDSAGLRTFTSHYADVDPETGHGVVITEDVAEEGATFLDGLSEYSVEQTKESLAGLAKLHAAFWNEPSVADLPWLAPRMASVVMGRGIKEITGNFDGPIGAGVPDDVRDPQRLVDTYKKLANEVANSDSWTVVHGDTHVGNVYLDPQGQPSWLDWQTVQRGAWYVDVGYHIASALPVEERRLHETELVQHYLAELEANGVAPPPWDEAWDAVRRGAVGGFFFWGITLRVHPSITTSLLYRIGNAVSDWKSFELIEARA